MGKFKRGGEEATIKEIGDEVEISKDNGFCKITVTMDKSKFQRGDEGQLIKRGKDLSDEELKSIHDNEATEAVGSSFKFQRGDTAGKFQRGNSPAELCYVCHKEIAALTRLKEAREDDENSELHIKLQGVVAEKVVRLIQKGVQIFRHADGCEPGSPRYMKNAVLAKSYQETFDN